jgi:P4 family phage/plasmid primase-like protien
MPTDKVNGESPAPRTKSEIETAKEKPPPVKVNAGLVPQVLRDLGRWVLWRWERPKKGRWTKVPYDPHRRRGKAKSDDPSTWGTIDEARGAWTKDRKYYDGIGFMITEGDGFVGIDPDEAIDLSTGELKPWAQRIVDELATYTELSPTQTGVKLWAVATKPGSEWCKEPYADGEVEMYDHGRFFTVTGYHWHGTPATVEERQEQVAALYHEVLDAKGARKSPPAKGAERNGPAAHHGLSDDQIIDKAERASNGHKFRALMDGDTGAYGNDQSRADLALCCIVAFYTKDAGLIDQVFRRSKLCRDKWDERRKDSTYGKDTVARALELVTEQWTPGGKPGANGRPHDHDGEAAEEKVNEAVDDPHRLARLYLDDHQHRDGPTIRHHREEMFRWNGQCYGVLPDDDLRGELSERIKDEFDRANLAAIAKWEANGEADENGKSVPKPVAKKVTTRLKADVAGALAGMSALPSTVEQPVWLGEPPFPAGEVLCCRNGLLHLPSWADGKSFLHPLTPSFFSVNGLPYDFLEKTSAPEIWTKFLRELWPDDAEAISTLQEWFGYCLLPDTSQQKILMILGPTRSGKGTIARVLRALVGKDNLAAPTLSSLGTNFGLQPLLGKTLAVISDARLSGRHDIAAVVERLLSISGEDAQTVDRKHRSPVTTKLLVRFLVISNELPRLNDSSGALVGRLVILRQTRSWYGREDQTLTARLMGELPQILLWAMAGWKRLRDRGHFVQPGSGCKLVQEMHDLSSPIGAFLRECCEVGAGYDVQVKELFDRWKLWCDEKGRREYGTEQVFGRDLRSAVPALDTRQRRTSAGVVRFFEGIRLKQDEMLGGEDREIYTPF